jgi:hypothetical protein
MRVPALAPLIDWLASTGTIAPAPILNAPAPSITL